METIFVFSPPVCDVAGDEDGALGWDAAPFPHLIERTVRKVDYHVSPVQPPAMASGAAMGREWAQEARADQGRCPAPDAGWAVA